MNFRTKYFEYFGRLVAFIQSKRNRTFSISSGLFEMDYKSDIRHSRSPSRVVVQDASDRSFVLSYASIVFVIRKKSKSYDFWIECALKKERKKE